MWIRDLTHELDQVSGDLEEDKENLYKIQNPVRKKVVISTAKDQQPHLFFTTE